MYELHNADCMDWLSSQPENFIHAVVTDPPYALREYRSRELEKMRSEKGGVWRHPPSFDGARRRPLPRFSVINDNEQARRLFSEFFECWGREVLRVMRPGAHLIIASTPLLSDILSGALRRAGFERRGEIVRLVKTLRGGDRPKGAERIFPDVSVLPRAHWEPWELFRKPCSEKTTGRNLARWGTGGLRRPDRDKPFTDVIICGRTAKDERILTEHPSQKPLNLMLILTKAALPVKEGIILDPFMGAGTTIAAAEAQNLNSIGVEKDAQFFVKTQEALPELVLRAGQLLQKEKA